MPLLRTHRTEPIGQLELFAGLTPGELAEARRLLTLVTVDAGTVLMREGGLGLEFLVIAGGDADVAIGGQTVARLGRRLRR